MNFSEYAVEWRDEILCLKKPASISTMQSHIRKADKAFGNLPFNRITEKLIQQHITKVSGELSPKSVKSYWATIRLVFKQAKKEGLIREIPSPELPKATKQPQKWLTVEQIRSILNSELNQEEAALYTLLAETGLRAGEAFALKVGDLDPVYRKLSINKSIFAGQTQTPKTQNAVRTLSLTKNLSWRLECLCVIAGKSGYLFKSNRDTPVRQSNVLKGSLHPLLDSLGIPRCGFHAFRRGNASIMAQIGVPEKIAADRLGHGIIGLTFGSYAQTVQNADAEWAEKIGEVIHV